MLAISIHHTISHIVNAELSYCLTVLGYQRSKNSVFGLDALQRDLSNIACGLIPYWHPANITTNKKVPVVTMACDYICPINNILLRH